MPVLGILDGIVQSFELATQTWFTTLFPIAQNLFFALMVIQIAWVGIWSTLGRHEGGEQVLVHILRQVFVLSILYTVLVFSPIWVPTTCACCRMQNSTRWPPLRWNALYLLLPNTVLPMRLAATKTLYNAPIWMWYTWPRRMCSTAKTACFVSKTAFRCFVKNLLR